MVKAQLAKDTVSSLFDRKFQESFDLARPFMSDFQKNMVAKLQKNSAEGSPSRQQELYEECMSHLEEGLLNAIMRISREIKPRSENVRRLRTLVDQVLKEAGK